MNARQFFQRVADQATVLSVEEAADLTRATLEVLANRVSNGEARRLAEQLPEGLREYMPAHDRSESFGLAEFLQRVSTHTGLTVKDTEAGVRSVLMTLSEEVDPEVFDHVMGQLPGEFRTMIGLPV